MKTILASIPTEREFRPLIDASLSLAKTFGARLDAVAIGYEASTIGLAMDGGAAMAAVFEMERKRASSRAKAVLSIVEIQAQQIGVPCCCMPMTAAPFEADIALSALARMRDLTIALQPEAGLDTFDNALPQELLFGSGGPVLFVPYTHQGPLKLGRVGIAWDGSRLAARAVRDALPFLNGARKITIMTINETESPHVSAEALKTYLSDRQLESTIIRATAAPADIQPTMLSMAADEGLDLIVMGGYGHSRLRERILGGVTREMFNAMTIPTLMSH